MIHFDGLVKDEIGLVVQLLWECENFVECKMNNRYLVRIEVLTKEIKMLSITKFHKNGKIEIIATRTHVFGPHDIYDRLVRNKT